jgi:mannosyltransferase OCH1-like enzyme
MEYLIYIVILIIVYFLFSNKESFTDLIKVPHFIPRKINASKNYITPLDVYMTWGFSDVPQGMYDAIMNNVEINPEFNFYIYNDDQCREYIRENFDNDVLEAFDDLLPGAYKADLWRYCILYKKGGVYMDIKYITKVKLLDIIDTFPICLTQDRYPDTSYNGFMISSPNFKIFDLAIKQIVINVKNKYYGSDPVSPTGPGLLGTILKQQNYASLNRLIFNNDSIYNRNNILLLDAYPTYRKEQSKYQKSEKYPFLWSIKKIYLSDIV